MYSIYIISHNEEGVLVKLCSLFTARGLSIETLHAQPLNNDKSLSSIEMTVHINEDKINIIREKILQIVPVRDIKIFKITEIVF